MLAKQRSFVECSHDLPEVIPAVNLLPEINHRWHSCLPEEGAHCSLMALSRVCVNADTLVREVLDYEALE